MTRFYTDEHEWIDVDGDSACVGITDYAQSQLGDIVFVDLPEAGARVAKGADRSQGQQSIHRDRGQCRAVR